MLFFYMDINDQIMLRTGVRGGGGGWGFINTFFSNHFHLPIMKGYTLEDKLLTKIMEVSILDINS